MGRLSSPHLVRVLDAGADASSAYLVMDRLEGSDLSDLTKRKGALEVRELADYAMQACEALSHAHAKGIVHRDVKPSNLFVHETEEGKSILKVLDFGISKVLAGDDVPERTLTSSADGGVLGSPPYMSPEQIRDPRTVDSRTDIWSLGILMYKALAGSLPFDGDSVGEIFARVLERRYAPLRTVANVPPELDAVVERCLAKDRRERFANVGELALALAPFASPEHSVTALAIAERMHNEARTLEEVSSERSRKREDREPSTLTADEPPHGASGVKGVAANGIVALPGVGDVATSDVISSSASLAPPTPRRSRLPLVLIGVGVAAGLTLGFLLRTPRADVPLSAGGPPPAVTSISQTPPSPSSAAVASPEPASPVATSAVAVTSPAPSSSLGSKLDTRRGGPKKPAAATAAAVGTAPATTGGTGAPGAPAAASPGAASPAAAPTARPELQPSPYGAP